MTPKLGDSWVSYTSPFLCARLLQGWGLGSWFWKPPWGWGGDRQIYLCASKPRHHSRVHSDLSANYSFPTPLP